MGWVIERAGLWRAHEGYPAYLTRDGGRAAAATSDGIVVERLNRAEYVSADQDPDLVIGWAEVVGWQAACSCGWAGQQWRRRDLDPDVDLRAPADPDRALLAPKVSVSSAAREDWEHRHIEPLQLLADIRAAAAAHEQTRHQLDQAVTSARARSAPLPWAEIGPAAGMSRQSAHTRWGRLASPVRAPDD